MKKDIAILVIHGFGGDISEISPLCDIMLNKGYDVSAPILAGHGGSKEALAKTKFTDWIESAMQAYVELQTQYEHVAVIGFSMGGLIAVNLFNIYPFDFLITVNSPIYYWNVKAAFHNLETDFSTTARKYLHESHNKSVSSLVEFIKILDFSKDKFKNVTCDTLVIQAKDDDTVKPKSAEYIYNSVIGYKKKLYYESGGHIILNTNNVTDIADKIDLFLRR